MDEQNNNPGNQGSGMGDGGVAPQSTPNPVADTTQQMPEEAAAQPQQKCVTCGNASSGGTCVACGQGEVSCTCQPAPGAMDPSQGGGQQTAPAV